MTFAIIASVPMYDNRDGICGSQRRQATPTFYETKALALRMACREASRDEFDETNYFVVDTTDAYRRPIYPEVPARCIDDDIIF